MKLTLIRMAQRCRAKAKDLAPRPYTREPDTSRTDDWNALAEMFEAEAKSKQPSPTKK